MKEKEKEEEEGCGVFHTEIIGYFGDINFFVFNNFVVY